MASLSSAASASSVFKFPHHNKYMVENFPNANKNVTINLNSVVFEYNIQMCEITYEGTVINAIPNFELYVTTIDFFDLKELRRIIGPLNFIKLDQVYNFVGKRPNRPQSTKSPVPFLPFYDRYTGTIYYSNEPIEQLIERMDCALTSLNVKFTRQNYCYYIQGSKIEMKFLGAALCYIFLIYGLNYFIIKPRKTVSEAFLFGLVIYGVYETTSYALLSKWSIFTVFIDTLWGGILFALTTFIINKLKKIF